MLPQLEKVEKEQKRKEETLKKTGTGKKKNGPTGGYDGPPLKRSP